MYDILLFVHSFVRWAVLLSLCYAVYRAWRGYSTKAAFSKHDDLIRHSTATILHVQFVVGVILYIKSPLIRAFWANSSEAINYLDVSFFALIHAILILIAVGIVTVGSAKAKRMPTSHQQYKTMLAWFSIALFLILVAIPWPFSPLAERPLIRPY